MTTTAPSKTPLVTSNKTSSKGEQLGPLGIPTSEYAASVAHQHEVQNRVDLYMKYNSVPAMDRDHKIAFFKDPKTTPALVANGYDGLTIAMQRWQDLNKRPEVAGLSSTQRTAFASDFYKKVLAPQYAKMGVTAISEDNWQKNAFGEALKYNIDTAYDSHWRSGLYAGFAGFENIFHSVIGGAVKLFEKSAVAQETMQTGDRGAFARLTANTLSKLDTSLKTQISTDHFWHDINPDVTFKQAAMSFVIEQAMTLPLYTAVGGFTGGLVGGLTKAGVAAEGLANTTKTLEMSKKGQLALKLMLNGTEGAAYGYTMRDDGDRHNAWKDAIGQAVLGTVFGQLVEGRTERLKLKDVASPEVKLKLAAAEENIELGKKDMKIGDIEDLLENLKNTSAGLHAAGGAPLNAETVREAFTHVRYSEGLSKDAIKANIKENLTRDKARYHGVYVYAQYLRALLGERKLSTLSPEDMADVMTKFHTAITQGAEEMSARVAPLAEKNAAHAIDTVKKLKGGPKSIETAVAKLKAEAAAKGLKPRPDSEWVKIAEAQIGSSNAKMAATAAKRKTVQPLSDALDVDEARQELVAALKTRTRNLVGKDRYVSVAADYNVYMKKQAKAAGLTDKQWLDGLSSEDFAKDLYDIWLPKGLQEEGITFEAADRSHDQNPNFLAFMRNYKHYMPKIMQDRLDQELIDTDKFEKFLNPRIPQEKQLDYYTKGMWNHVSDFMASDRFKKPNALGQTRNIYKSTYQNLKDPTAYQLELHDELIDTEKDLIRGMFKGKQGASNIAVHGYNLLAAARKAAFIKGDQDTRRAIQEKIDDMILEYSKGKRERRDF